MRFWQYVNILSIDVSLGAVVGCAFFARILGISLLPHALISLGLIVWVVYTVDHLVDAYHGQALPATERHRFHKRHAKQLLMAAIVAGILIAGEVFLVRKPVLFAGMGLGILVIAYLLLQASLKFAKEAAGAILYTAGVLVAPWSLLQRPLTTTETGLIALLALTAFTNLLLCSWFDQKSDEQDNQASFATTFGERITRHTITLVFVLLMVVAAMMLWENPAYTLPLLTLVFMNGVLLLTFRFRDYFEVNDRYRRVGDSVFLIPLLYLFLS